MARMLYVGQYDIRTFAAAILSIVQQGAAELQRSPKGVYSLKMIRGTKPKRSAEKALYNSLLRGGPKVSINSDNYVLLMQAHKKHKRLLDAEDVYPAFSSGATGMAALGLSLALIIAGLAVLGRHKGGESAATILMPYWPVPAAAYGLLYGLRRAARRLPLFKGPPARAVAGYAQFLRTAMDDRLDPYFVTDGRHKEMDRALPYAVAFAIENSWADPFVHALEGLLPVASHDTSLRGLEEKHRFRKTNDNNRQH